MNLAFARTVAWRVFATGVQVISGLVTLRLLSRHVSTADYAVVGAALAMMTYLPLLDGGFRMVVNRRLLAGDVKERTALLQFSQVLQSWVGLGALAIGAIAMIAYSVTPNARKAGEPLAFYLALGGAGAAGMLSQMQASLLTGLGRQAQVFALNGFTSIANVVLLGLCFHFNFGVWAFPASLFGGAVLQFFAAGYFVRSLEPGLPFGGLHRDSEFRRRLGELKQEAIAAFRSQTSILFLFSCDAVIVGFVPQQAEAATYLVLVRIFGIVRNCLQAANEAMWPLVAQGHDGARRFEQPLLRLNAWICGAALGACVPTLPPFLDWLMKEDWRPSPLLVSLFAARFCITTLSSPAAYFLLGRGEFQGLARFVERELIAAVLLSIPFGWRFGPAGVAMAFLIATALGTLTPILARYSRLVHQAPRTLFSAIWWRGVVAAGLAIGVGYGLVRILPAGPVAVGAGLIAALAGILPGAALAWSRHPLKSGLSRSSLANILRAF